MQRTRKFYKVVLLTAMVLLASSPFLLAEEPALTPQPNPMSFGIAFGLGVVTLGDDTYQQISLSPDFSIGNFGIGVDITIHFRYEGDNLVFRQEDWVPDDPSFLNVLALYLSKFKYIRYGMKGDDLYLKFGSINDAVLGNGFIMGYYSNELFLPERRIFGLTADLDGNLFGFPFLGIETFVSDLAFYDVLGARLYVRPLAALDIGVFSALQVGYTFAADFDPFRYADSTGKALAVSAGVNPDDAIMYLMGLDVRQPLVNLENVFDLAVFGDVVTNKFEAYGSMVGFGGRIISIFTYMAQIRFVGEGFIPVYFDATYDLNRAIKYLDSVSDLKTPGYIGWLASLGTSLLGDALIFNLTVDGPFGRVDSNDDNYLNFPHIRAFFGLSQELLGFISFDAVYDKILIREFSQIFTPEGALVKARINYHVEGAVISFFYLLKYDSNDWSSPEVTSGLETSIQF